MSTVRVADYIARNLVQHGIRDVFLVTGGGAMHLNDAIGRCEGLRYICCHHEQACAMAAEAYARVTGKVGVINVTTGPGGINALNGVFGAWTDSIPLLVLSGQVKYQTTVASSGLPMRQLGDQEADIVGMVRGITKYAVMVTDAASIRYHLERAFYVATHGRPGPVWLDIPLDVQAAFVDEASLAGYDPAKDAAILPPAPQEDQLHEIAERLLGAKRPIILLGTGVRLSGAVESVSSFVEKLGAPVVTAWNAHDLIPDSHPLYVGRPGTVGDRAGNYAVQTADLVLVLGCRLNVRQVSYNWENFAARACKIVVDADLTELRKPTVRPDLPVHADVKALVDALAPMIHASDRGRWPKWLEWCLKMRSRYPVCQAEYWASKERVNPYCFMQALSAELPEGAITVSANGSACVCGFQTMTVKHGQRLFTNSGSASMGYDLPAAIGAFIASGGKDIVCLAGDGSLQMNLQELATIVGYGVKAKIFILNNQGYHSIRQTQQAFFGGPAIGCDATSGVWLPETARLARAYRLPYVAIRNHGELKRRIRSVLRRKGAVLCEVLLDPTQPFAPKLSSRKLPDGSMVSSPLEDMAPFLERSEHEANVKTACSIGD